MGIINVTPDSFYSGSRGQQTEEILKRVQKMLTDGADIIDVGGQSTRPDSQLLSAKEELNRVIPVIKEIHNTFPDTIISTDTFYAEVAEAAVENGASLINDVSGGSLDKNMLATTASLNVPYICMHMRGTPQTMQLHTDYDDVCREVLDYFLQKIDNCTKAGIKDIIIDPGFGFAKTIQQNLLLLKNLSIFKITGKPVVAGLSRKSTIYKTLGISPEDSLNGTTVLNTLALHNGAGILRVHDVKEAKEAVRLFSAYRNS